jgi:alkanesulfonate monooxygenase SsuD/methylene tetrahydromethanopterin reductase-like flavin-dependent oxidoreductase (luciferase family)
MEVAGRYADIVAIGTHSRELFQQQRQIVAAAAGERFERIELASLVFLAPEGDERAAQAAAEMARRLGADLDAMIADKAPNVLVGSHEAMIEQLELTRSTLGLSYIVIGVHNAEWFARVVQRLAGK